MAATLLLGPGSHCTFAFAPSVSVSKISPSHALGGGVTMSSSAAMLAEEDISKLLLKHDPLLHWARRLLPERRAAAASALYGWCRRLDEIVDEPNADASQTIAKLDDWERRLDELWNGSPRDAMDGALLETLRAYPSLGREPFDAMLAGMRADIDDTNAQLRYQSFRPELLQYCYRVAGTVGEMLLPVLGLDGDDEVAEAAVAFGCAVQLLNIARDVRSDLVERDRIYLPLDDAARCGLTEAQLEAEIRNGGPAGEGLRRLVRLQSRRATALLRRAEAALPDMTLGQALVVGVLIELHHELVRSLAARDFDCLPPAASREHGGATAAAATRPFDSATAAAAAAGKGGGGGGAIANDFERVRVSSSQKIVTTASTAASVLLRGPAGHYDHIRAQRQARAGAAPVMVAGNGDGSDEVPSWEALEAQLPSLRAPQPSVLDTVLAASCDGPPDGLTLFRERHGWCPYSEKVWLALELKGLDYSTVLIDNTGGGRPSWYGGQTPQIQWCNGKTMGESMDIVKRLDIEYPESRQLYPPEGVSMSDVASMISAFRGAFPSNAKPSSRAAYLFTYSGPLSRSDFERALDNTEELLATHSGGSFFCGKELSAADVSWAPFLERYAAQLPCLHEGLLPRDASRWPRLAEWFEAMDNVPEYACRVKGDGESWGRVLSMQGYGNAGRAPKTTGYRAQDAAGGGGGGGRDAMEGLWSAYSKSRPHVASSPAKEAAAKIVSNRQAIVKDAMARKLGSTGNAAKKPFTSDEIERGLRAVASALVNDGAASLQGEERALGGALASHLVGRMCVPRDMGQPAGFTLRELARELGAAELGDAANSAIRKYD